MAKKTLNIVESAYRAVMEEQDDTILWVLAAMQGAGAAHTVVLRGNAVNYAVAGQGAPGLSIGAWKQTLAPRMDNDVVDLIEKRQIPVFVIEEDVALRGIERESLLSGVKLMSVKAPPPPRATRTEKSGRTCGCTAL
jgi:sulfur transfer complex TusBCD TusB component (DsrH family)